MEVFDSVRRRAVTRTGQVYELGGLPGVNGDAFATWGAVEVLEGDCPRAGRHRQRSGGPWARLLSMVLPMSSSIEKGCKSSPN